MRKRPRKSSRQAPKSAEASHDRETPRGEQPRVAPPRRESHHRETPRKEATSGDVSGKLYYPAFIDLGDKPCVVVGGGKVAERKVLGLIEAAARVTVISPNLTEKLQKEKSAGALKHIKRKFTPADLRGVYLVVAATDSPKDNRGIADAADIMGIPLINAVDMPEHCNFIVPSVLRQGPLAIAVSTSGASPATAAAIRQELEGLYGAAFGSHLKELARRRAWAMGEIKNPEERERFLKSLASDKILKDLREGKQPSTETSASEGILKDLREGIQPPADARSRHRRRRRPRRKATKAE